MDQKEPTRRDDIELASDVAPVEPAAGATPPALVRRLTRLLLFVTSLAAFVVAIELIKAGAAGAATVIEAWIDIGNAPNALGFGWLGTYIVMSGSPVAAVSVGFMAAGAVSRLAGFAMIIGSRLGASFIVLFIGFVYVLRGHERRSGLSMGLLSLMVTASVYLPAMALGTLLLESELLDAIQFSQGTALSSLVDPLVQPLIDVLLGFLPGWAVMLAGLAVIWISFYLFDRIMPHLDLEHSRFSQVAHVLYRPVIMLALGALLTLITLSVSLSLSLLVPLSARGYVRQENAIPYIMGANITTFIDTLLATLLLGSDDAFTVVLVCMVSVTVSSLAVLLLFFQPYERLLLQAVDWTTATNRNLALFMFIILAVPLLLLLV